MKIIQASKETYKNETVVTIGTFDGVHIGHQKIIQRLINTAKQHHLESVLLTFFPHPRMVLQKDANIKLINTIEERSAILKQLGLDSLLIKKFTKEFSRLSAEKFVQTILIDQLNAKKVIIGYDHHFGRNRSANIVDLKNFGNQLGFDVEEISSQEVNDVAVSSTKIRKALDSGDIKKANTFLGYNFMLTGSVIRGKGLGKQLDFPTANLYIKESYKLIPKHGVYVVTCEHKGEQLFGMMNIGINPTIASDNKLSIEIHFFNFKGSLYNSKIQVELLSRLRDEEKFDSVEALQKQLKKDQLKSLEYLKNHATR